MEVDFADEMRSASLKLHSKDQSREGTKDPEPLPFRKWNPTIEGYLQFLADSKAVFAAIETITAGDRTLHENNGELEQNPKYPTWFEELTNTGLERSGKLDEDLAWFVKQGHAVPDPSSAATSYVIYLEQLATSDPMSFLCHYYNVVFGHSKGGLMIARKVSRDLLDGKRLEFYKWDAHLPDLLRNVKDKMTGIAKNWSDKEKQRCLQETETAFAYYSRIIDWVRSP